MTDIKDLELRIKSAESTLEMLRGELEELRQQEQQEPEQESLLGRWATHPTYGRGIITDVEPSADGDVEFAFPDAGDCETRTSSIQVTLDEIDLDPVTLNGEQGFGKAPVGTIVENIKTPQDVYVKSGAVWYITGDTLGTLSEGMPACRVIRWGNGQ
ncbi:hypothetical protein [Corynebacterium sp. LK26]|uniref:hypothetical protein n=1 Tax=Corynebacterium sp. LK26 TaxID=2044581 RepID=UPI001651D5A3|nr:hypothetical protein [Corynebacterium sp. LK26]MBC6792658.1 hypothetical protein [Corynebacterium sp. LK26]